jgi:hypothetical protein
MRATHSISSGVPVTVAPDAKPDENGFVEVTMPKGEKRRYNVVTLTKLTPPPAPEPIANEPAWRETPGGFHDANGGKSFNTVPIAYAHGMEDGAFALARKLLDLKDWELIIKTLLTYNDGSAHPLRGWKSEPKR